MNDDPGTEVVSPFLPAIIETLQTAIAPGRRVRLSPFIEAIQYQIVFDRKIDPRTRNDQARQIIEQNRNIIASLAQEWVSFMDRGKVFEANTYNDFFLKSYLLYYLTTNFCKTQMVLIEILKQHRLKGRLSLIDFGVGAGTTALAVLDFLTAWASICNLYGAELPIHELVISGYDANQACLRFAGDVVKLYTQQLNIRLQARPKTISDDDSMKRIAKWADSAEWHLCDLNVDSPTVPKQATILVAANILNELKAAGKMNVGKFISHLPPDSLAVVIEPGDKKNTIALNNWRKELIMAGNGLVPIAPCGEEFGDHQPEQCDICWNRRHESLHEPHLYRKFREAASELRHDKRSFDDIQNDLLSWSYVCLHRTDGQTQRPIALEAPNNNTSKTRRFIDQYDGHLSAHCSDTLDAIAPVSTETRCLLKLCPGKSEASEVVYQKDPGFEVPKLTHGDLVIIDRVKAQKDQQNDRVIIKRLDNDEYSGLRSLFPPPKNEDSFLRQYSENTKAELAIDEIAYRLFGFPGMRPFQHQILSRVLTGRSILGIAATGGGKSECFILPAMLLPGLTIVVSPLKSLMQDQYEQRICERYGLGSLSTYINGDVPFKERETRLKRMEMGYYKLVYFTPEQLERNYVLASLKRADERIGIRYITLDEAHCISQWGHDFRPSYLNLLTRLEHRGIEPVRIALTATASPEVQRDVCEELRLIPKPLEEGGDVYIYSANRPELNFIVRVKDSAADKSDAILEDLRNLKEENRNNTHPGAAIVFMPHTGNSNHHESQDNQDIKSASMTGSLSAGVTSFASYIEKNLGEKVSIYHGKMDWDTNTVAEPEHEGSATRVDAPLGSMKGRGRRKEQNDFIADQSDIMIATKGFGMGIDKPNIRKVIHRTPTANLEAYAQEAGRAGRDGLTADAILYYSPEKPFMEGKEGISDYEIQAFFLREKYIRREDVLVMREFLKTVDRRVGKYFYFTNDEAMAFFDDCARHPALADLNTPYSWSKFPPRAPKGKEFFEHKLILDRGYEYQQKTDYIGRILAVLYRIRPDLNRRKHLAFLSSCQETGVKILEPQILNGDALCTSNHYFGEILRSKKIGPKELKAWISESSEHGMLRFAEYLGLSLTETAAMFWDMNKADGCFRNGKWRSNLLHFKAITVPLYGLAAGMTSPRNWLEYAGATTRATKKEADENAAKNNRTKPTLEDWFSWKQLPKSKGWEIEPGPAFDSDVDFEKYIQAFMEKHDERKSNDWEAYRYLLTDYVGVDKEGRTLHGMRKTCLRAVLLGYLKTNEVVAGGNCLSCSRCVPNGKYEPDIEKRKNVVVRLRKDIVALLQDIEEYSEAVPPDDKIRRLWAYVSSEQTRGSSFSTYVAAWTGRLVHDRPGHQAALWLRIQGMINMTIPMQRDEFLDNARQLEAVLQKRSMMRLWRMLNKADEFIIDSPELFALQAKVCQRLSLHQEERSRWEQLLSQQTGSADLFHEAHAALCIIYSTVKELFNRDKFLFHSWSAARTANDPDIAMRYYQDLIGSWDWDQLEEEMIWLEQKADDGCAIAARLLAAFMKKHSADEISLKAATFISNTSRFKRWPITDIINIIHKIPKYITFQFTQLTQFWITYETESTEATKRPMTFLRELLSYAEDEVRKRSIEAWPLLELVLNSIIERKAKKNNKQVFLRKSITSLQQGNPIFNASRGKILVLLADPTVCEKIHKHWMKVCRSFPEEAIPYIRHCVSESTVEHHLPEDAFDVLLGSQDSNLYRSFSEAISSNHLFGYSKRIGHAAEFISLMEQVAQQTDLASASKMESRHVSAIMEIFEPRKNVNRADMASILIESLADRFNSQPSTYVNSYIEALGYARRFNMAKEISSKFPRLMLGIAYTKAILQQFKKQGERTQAEFETEYRKIIDVMTMTWNDNKNVHKHSERR